MSLVPTAPLDAWRIADHLGVPVLPMSGLGAEIPGAVRFFRSEGRGEFSAVTVFRDDDRTIVVNDSHALVRQTSNVVHELSHGLLLHPRTVAIDEQGRREWDPEIEAEANWLCGALLVPQGAALLIVERDWSPEVAAEKYGVSRQMLQFRIDVTAARRRVRRRRAKRATQGILDAHWP